MATDSYTAEHPHTVLLVEDEINLREMMADALEARGYSVVTAEEGQEALQKLEGMPPPCVILLDLLMPGMNGWDFFERLRSLPELASVPVIIHSSTTSRPPDGAARVLKKPLGFERLLSIIGEYCAP